MQLIANLPGHYLLALAMSPFGKWQSSMAAGVLAGSHLCVLLIISWRVCCLRRKSTD